jgi:hypothetical protein
MDKVFMKRIIGRSLVAAAVLVVTTSTRAAVTMALDDWTTHAEEGFTAVLNGHGQIISEADDIGIYRFNVSAVDPGLVISSPFYSVCLSPAGNLGDGAHTYDPYTFAQANPGINPQAWASQGGDYWGIQNANYLFQHLSGGVLATAGQAGKDAGAALALAMYEALYDSNGYGSLGDEQLLITGLNVAAQAYLKYDLDYLSSLSKSVTAADLPVGYVLRPNPIAAQFGQDLAFLGTGVPQVHSSVPEPATLAAGALLLLPFGTSVLRVLRQKRLV